MYTSGRAMALACAVSAASRRSKSERPRNRSDSSISKEISSPDKRLLSASIAANKVRGVRAALCTDAETAAGARRWNDANVLVMSLRLTSPPLAHEMLDAWFGTAPDPSEAPNIGRLEP